MGLVVKLLTKIFPNENHNDTFLNAYQNSKDAHREVRGYKSHDLYNMTFNLTKNSKNPKISFFKKKK